MKTLVLIAFTAAAALAQTAIFPTAVVTDEQLKVQVNGVQTVLTAPLTTTSSSVTVAACTGIIPSAVVSVDQEIIAISGCTGNTLAFDAASPGCTSGRGCDSTTPAMHFSGASVSLYIVAWHHNALRKEVEAIETALGAGLSNVASSGSATPVNVAHTWTAGQTFSAGLGATTVGISGTLGVSGASTLAGVTATALNSNTINITGAGGSGTCLNLLSGISTIAYILCNGNASFANLTATGQATFPSLTATALNSNTINITGAGGSGTCLNLLSGISTIAYILCNGNASFANLTVGSGVTCSGTPTSSFATSGGIVTHC